MHRGTVLYHGPCQASLRGTLRGSRRTCDTFKTNRRQTVAEKYKINAKGFEDKTFTRNDLQKVIGEVEKAPELKRAPTRGEKAKGAVEDVLFPTVIGFYRF